MEERKVRALERIATALEELVIAPKQPMMNGQARKPANVVQEVVQVDSLEQVTELDTQEDLSDDSVAPMSDDDR